MDNQTKILSTRPLGDTLCQVATEHGILVDEHSFIQITAFDPESIRLQVMEANEVVIFTSMNAVESVLAALDGKKPEWEIYLVGNTTSELLSNYFGSVAVKMIAPDSAALATEILHNKGIQSVTYFCGNLRRDELPAILKANGVIVKEIEVYHTNLLSKKVDEHYKGILFFSPSAVNSFFMLNDAWPGLVFFAIGNTTAAEISKYTRNAIVKASAAGKASLLQTAIDYFGKHTCTE